MPPLPFPKGKNSLEEGLIPFQNLIHLWLISSLLLEFIWLFSQWKQWSFATFYSKQEAEVLELKHIKIHTFSLNRLPIINELSVPPQTSFPFTSYTTRVIDAFLLLQFISHSQGLEISNLTALSYQSLVVCTGMKVEGLGLESVYGLAWLTIQSYTNSSPHHKNFSWYLPYCFYL